MKYTSIYNLKIIEPDDLFNIRDISENFEKIEETLKSIKVFHIGDEPPDNISILWIDTNPSTGGLKYHNGIAWVHTPVAYS